MEVISIDGIDYEKVTTLAKRFKYTTDYIGQLCRAGKVQAKLIGRTWYVHEPSLQNHKKIRYKKTSSNDIDSNESSKIKISRLDVAPVLAKTTARVIETKAKQSLNYARHVDWKPVKYAEDDSALLPELSGARSKDPVSVPVDLADGTAIEIQKTSPTTTVLEPMELPMVSLQGKIAVASVDSYFDNSQENIVISDDIAVNTRGQDQDHKVSSPNVKRVMGGTSRSLPVHDSQTSFLDAGITKPSISVEQIRPVSIVRDSALQTDAETDVPGAPSSLPWLGFFILISLFVIMLILVATLELKSFSDAVVFSSTLSWSDGVELVRIWQEVINIF